MRIAPLFIPPEAYLKLKAVIAGLTSLRCVGKRDEVPTFEGLTSTYEQHDFNATQVPPEWHAWIHHIRKDPPVEDRVMQNLSPPWKAVRLR